MGSLWYSDLQEPLVTILMNTGVWTSSAPAEVAVRDFWTLAYAAIDD